MSIHESRDIEIYIDGSIFEGGGQILRNAVSLAAICCKNILVDKIRAGRERPGLSNQHLTGLQLAAELSDANLIGCFKSSSRIEFRPGRILNGEFSADAKTAGSVALMAQISVPILAFSSTISTIFLHGGTDASFAPPIDYISQVTSHYYSKMGIDFNVEVIERGYYPQGGGKIKVDIKPIKYKLIPINLCDLGSLTRIHGVAFVAGKCPIKIAEEMCFVGRKLFRQYFPECPLELNVMRAPDNRFNGSVSTFLFIVETSSGCHLAASGIGQPRGPSTKQLVTDAIEQLVASINAGACCDVHMQDQLILPMALADGFSRIRTTELTLHTKSAIYVAELITGIKFNVEALPDGGFIMSCDGIGLTQATAPLSPINNK